MDSDLEKEPNHGPAVDVLALKKHNCTLVKRSEKSGGGGSEVRKFQPPAMLLPNKKPV